MTVKVGGATRLPDATPQVTAFTARSTICADMPARIAASRSNLSSGIASGRAMAAGRQSTVQPASNTADKCLWIRDMLRVADMNEPRILPAILASVALL